MICPLPRGCKVLAQKPIRKPRRQITPPLIIDPPSPSRYVGPCEMKDGGDQKWCKMTGGQLDEARFIPFIRSSSIHSWHTLRKKDAHVLMRKVKYMWCVISTCMYDVWVIETLSSILDFFGHKYQSGQACVWFLHRLQRCESQKSQIWMGTYLVGWKIPKLMVEKRKSKTFEKIQQNTFCD